jgi:hypothetical protein
MKLFSKLGKASVAKIESIKVAIVIPRIASIDTLAFSEIST